MVKLVLVQGHPGPFNTHYMKSYIEQYVRNDYADTEEVVKYQTADEKKNGTQTYEIDAFDPHDKYKNTFDTLWLPDLGGLWYDDQRLAIDLNDCAKRLLVNAKNASQVVKENGHIYVSKFLGKEGGYTGIDLAKQMIQLNNETFYFKEAEYIEKIDGTVPGIHFVKHDAKSLEDALLASYMNQ